MNNSNIYDYLKEKENQKDRDIQIDTNANKYNDLKSFLNEFKKEDLINFILNKEQDKIYTEKDIKEFLAKNLINDHDKKEKVGTKSKTENKPDKKSRINFDDVRTIAFKFMYIGKNYDGLVFQNHTKNTVEEHILNALQKAKLIESIEKSNYSRCGRTDAGVSSTGNVFSVNLRYKPHMDYIKIINNLLPNDICVTGMAEVDNSFDARFSCLYREYKYFFLKNNMDIQKMRAACAKLEGVHNYKNFCKIDKSDPNYLTKNYERRIFEFKIEKYEKSFFPSDKILKNNIQDVNPYYELYFVMIKGSAFLWHQVRCMMGILFLIGRGLEEPEIIDTMLNETTNITYNYEIASEIPLVLTDCQYEFIHFENKQENIAESFINISKIYQDNIVQIAMNSFFLRNLIRPLSISNEEDALEAIEKNYRRKKNYTKMLNHKVNRQFQTKNTKK